MKKIFCIFVCIMCLCSCGAKENPIDINFQKTEGEYYLFDDNPEYLRPEYTADGENPSSVASFDGLGEGAYTVFSYHHRGTSADIEDELYFDVLFSADNAVIEFDNFCMDANWQWHKAWADYSGTSVERPLYFESSKCNCGHGGNKHKDGCAAVLGGDRFEPSFTEGLGLPVKISGNVLLSDVLERIKDDNLNKFRNTSAVDPMWLMMKFKVLSGDVSLSTVCYSDAEKAAENFSVMRKGAFFNEVQYKGKAACAPKVSAEFDYVFSDYVGAVPVKVKNIRAPQGYVCENGRFATSINTYREETPIAAESDMMCFEYKDASKTALYGSAANSDDVWRFDPFHTKLYGSENGAILKKYGAATGDDYEPNGKLTALKVPAAEEYDEEFYTDFGLNLGNFGVTYRFKINLVNPTDEDRVFRFNIDSDAPEVYRFSQHGKDGEEICSDGGKYIVKKFDNNPREGEEPEFMSDDIVFSVSGRSESFAEVEVVILTGCNAPVYYTFFSE